MPLADLPLLLFLADSERTRGSVQTWGFRFKERGPQNLGRQTFFQSALNSRPSIKLPILSGLISRLVRLTQKRLKDSLKEQIKRADRSENFGKISPHFSEKNALKIALKIEKGLVPCASFWDGPPHFFANGWCTVNSPFLWCTVNAHSPVFWQHCFFQRCTL